MTGRASDQPLARAHHGGTDHGHRACPDHGTVTDAQVALGRGRRTAITLDRLGGAVLTGFQQQVSGIGDATASRLAGLATLNATRVDDHWTGTAYRNTLPPQQAALTAIKTAGDEIDATLNELANAIFTFWITVAGAALALVVALYAVAATAASVIGAPVGAGIGIAALVAFAALVNETIKSLNTITTNSASRSAELERRLSNDTAFPGGAWPRSTTPISSDGSITDGDDTDWHLQ